MATLILSDEQVIELVKQLPVGQQSRGVQILTSPTVGKMGIVITLRSRKSKAGCSRERS